VESSKASNKASTGTDRKSSISAGLNNFFGAENRQLPADHFFNPFGSLAGTFDRSFEGGGSTQRSGDLTAYLTARVVDILPNGNLVLVGTREVGVNHEKQIITLSGIVRPKDISSDNQIQSIHISDAKISYSGKGAVNDPQRPGWLVRTLDAIWPF
jgi:flagellar L-ring protein precursor FlgH